MTYTNAILNSRNSNINTATGKPKKNSKWSSNNKRPSSLIGLKEEKKTKKSENPYRFLPLMTKQFKLLVRGYCVGLFFDEAEAIRAYKEITARSRDKSLLILPYQMPAGLSN
jgi:hypothetical protein